MKKLLLLLALSSTALAVDKQIIAPTGSVIVKGNSTVKMQTYNTGAWNDRLTIVNGGSVGIATTNPGRILDVGSNVSGLGGMVRITAGSVSNAPFIEFNYADAGADIKRTQIFADISGNINIYKATDAGSLSQMATFGRTGYLQLVSNIYSNGTTFINGAPADANQGILYLNPNSGQKTYILFGENGVANRWAIGTESGNSILYFRPGVTSTASVANINNSTGVYTATSDIRLKENIKESNYGLSEILELRPVKYNMKTDKEKKVNIGLIAQEVEKLIPEVVTDVDKGIKGLQYTALIPVLIKAIQEQQSQIQVLKNKLDSRN